MALALLVPGAGGQLSTDLLDLVRTERNAFARGLTIEDLDVTDPFAVKDMVGTWAKLLRDDSPDHQLVVVNAAAYTAVDRAESDEDTAYAVNATAPALLAQACRAAGARLIHVSTDYVFPGDRVGGPPYDVDDPTGPTNAYGRTKLAGEQAVRELHPDGGYVVRTAWLYGAGGANIVKTMARLEKERDTVAFVDDQRGSPTWSRDLAAGLIALARSEAPAGTYHCTNGGETTWRGLAQAVFEELGADPARVLPTTSDAYPTPASRPAYSVLSSRAWDQAGLPPRQGWREALAEAFATDGDSFRPS
ncbi:MAG: dTDP-4-dehydrorhamnose reductase [Frankiales bacterium]|nr:dTDP-4-dehydrorhamnose reductase [Frankiales bacterium]